MNQTPSAIDSITRISRSLASLVEAVTVVSAVGCGLQYNDQFKGLFKRTQWQILVLVLLEKKKKNAM